jgi:hypothetical protein
VLLEGTEPAARLECGSPEMGILVAGGGRASVFPGATIGGKARWSPSAGLEAGRSPPPIQARCSG